MARNEERLRRILENDDRRDRAEQKLGIGERMTKRRDERASRAMEKAERKKR